MDKRELPAADDAAAVILEEEAAVAAAQEEWNHIAVKPQISES